MGPLERFRELSEALHEASEDFRQVSETLEGRYTCIFGNFGGSEVRSRGV